MPFAAIRVIDVYGEDDKLVAYNLELSQPRKHEWTVVVESPVSIAGDEISVSADLLEWIRKFAYMGYILEQGKERS